VRAAVRRRQAVHAAIRRRRRIDRLAHNGSRKYDETTPRDIASVRPAARRRRTRRTAITSGRPRRRRATDMETNRTARGGGAQ